MLDERETAELREQFIAVLGHNLRTPLGSIISGADLLLIKPLDSSTLSIVERIRRSGKRISDLVDDVMDFTRGRMGAGIPLDKVTVDDLQADLHHLIDELKASYPDQVVQSDIVIDCPIVCDRVAQLFSNLLTNALIHGAPDQLVEVVARTTDGVFDLSIANGGRPIPDETMAQLFKPYSRGAASNSQGGLGLGLYIASQIARSHGGKLSATSIDGKTTFSFAYPLSAQSISR